MEQRNGGRAQSPIHCSDFDEDLDPKRCLYKLQMGTWEKKKKKEKQEKE